MSAGVTIRVAVELEFGAFIGSWKSYFVGYRVQKFCFYRVVVTPVIKRMITLFRKTTVESMVIHVVDPDTGECNRIQQHDRISKRVSVRQVALFQQDGVLIVIFVRINFMQSSGMSQSRWLLSYINCF